MYQPCDNSPSVNSGASRITHQVENDAVVSKHLDTTASFLTSTGVAFVVDIVIVVNRTAAEIVADSSIASHPLSLFLAAELALPDILADMAAPAAEFVEEYSKVFANLAEEHSMAVAGVFGLTGQKRQLREATRRLI